MTQEDMMIKDTVLVLDNDDNVIGSASKRLSHEFTTQKPRAILHRAFSVFLFDESTGELLLQQRASSKITFPNVRVCVNRCFVSKCRRRLMSVISQVHHFSFFITQNIGMDKHLLLASSSRDGTSRGRYTGRRRQGNSRRGEECCGAKAEPRTWDSTRRVARGTIQILDTFALLGRRYGDTWKGQVRTPFLSHAHTASVNLFDARTYHRNMFGLLSFSPWGENEIDYVLFFCVKNKSELTVKPHPDEVDDYKWVSPEKLLSMMDDKSLLFSPWFRLITKKWLIDSWWKDLNETMTTDKYCDYVNIHRFDPPPEHLGGCGKAGPLFAEKQGDER